MADASVIIYENHLKRAYSISSGGKILAITDTSCFSLAEETAWLTANLPETGGRKDYLDHLEGLGLADPEKILGKLLDIGALQEKTGRTWKGVLGMIFSPKIRLIPAQLQEKALCLIGITAARLGRTSILFVWPAMLGISWGIWLTVAGPAKALPTSLSGAANGLTVFLLAMAGSLAHELGHSFSAAAAGIGLRPIGFSVYLIYPAFYTNVSGIDKLSLKAKTMIDCGGFILQSVFILGLLLFSSLTGNASAAETVHWIIAIMLFNLNPFFRTDGYWLYKDTYSELKHNPWMRAVHYAYLLAFMLFSVYFLWFVFVRIERIWGDLVLLAHSPSYFFSGGYRVILGAYFVFIGLSGGLRRFHEGRKEFKDLTGVSSVKA
jgi:hypothetical protein